MKYKIPGGKRITLIDNEAILAFDEYYPAWDKTFYIVPPEMTNRDTLFGSDRGYEGEVKIAEVFKESKINGIFISNFSNKDQNNILQSSSRQSFECDFIFLTERYGLWLIEVCHSSKTKMQKCIKEKYEQLENNRKHILKLAEELYGEAFSFDLTKIFNGIIAVPNATSDDFECFRKSPLWQKFIDSNSCYEIEFLGDEHISKPLLIARFIRQTQLRIAHSDANHLRQFYSTLTLVKTSYKTVDFRHILSKQEKKGISGASGGMHVNDYNVILSPEQISILFYLPSHFQIIGEAATGKTEILKAVVHIIYKYHFDSSDCLRPNVSSLAKGINRIVYLILGDKPYLKENIEVYFSLLNKNLQPSQGEKMVFDIHSLTGNSFDDICDNMLKILESIQRRKNVFVLIDECYHWFENPKISEYLFSFKGCWIAAVLAGQAPQKVLQMKSLDRNFLKRSLRCVYRGTKGITLTSSSFRMSSSFNCMYLANKFSYVENHSDIKIEDIEQTNDSCKNRNESFFIVFRGKDGSQRLNDHKGIQFEEIELQKEKLDDKVVYMARFSGAEWKSVTIILNMSMKDFQLNSDVMYLLLSLCTSRALCKCLILCCNDIKEKLQKRIYPSSVTQAIRSGKCQDVSILQDNSIIKEFWLLLSSSPLSYAAGAYNLDLIESFLKHTEEELAFVKASEILFCLTEPSPDQRMVDVTTIILERSRHLFPMFEKFPALLEIVCDFQSENKWHLEIIKLIIDYFKLSDTMLSSLLFEAVSQNHQNCVTYLIEAKANVNIRSSDGITVLLMAAEKGHTSIVKYLIEANANVNMQSSDGTTPLLVAAENGHIDIVKYLIEANADGNMQNLNGLTALLMATQNGHIEIVKCLIEANANVNMQNSDGVTALLMAAQNGHIDIVKHLIKANAEVNIQGPNGITALLMAAQNGHIDIVKCVTETANVNRQFSDGTTAILVAAQNGHIDIVKYLIEANANGNMQNLYNLAALLMAAQN